MLGLFEEYNYERFTKSMLMKDMAASRDFGGAPRPGERAPDFALRTLEGDKIRLSDFRGEKNVVLTFGSATSPMTAGSIGGVNSLAEKSRGADAKFLFVYVREAHPGDEIPAHHSMAEKVRAAELLRAQEAINLPILVDDLRGSVHRRYSRMPAPTFIIDKSGRVAFRCLWTQPGVIEEALRQLLKAQKDRGVEHLVVLGGEDKSMAMSYPALFSYRALHRGGRRAILDFERALGFPGKVVVASSRIIGPVAENPGRTAAAAVLSVGVLAASIYAGRALRRRRFASLSPYEDYPIQPRPEGAGGDYDVVGI
jgi:alkyl hydroperoxide reductase subunit AhpC